MKFKKTDKSVGLALLLLRSLIGLIFIYHGFPKIFSMPSLLGLPSFMGLVVGIFEVGCGLLLILGYGSPYTIYPLVVIIAVALFGVQLKRGITASSERDLLILIALIALTALGFGKYSIDKKS
ncbi:MAG: DoxX family protein [Nanoarchaeota archaeon]